jgi:hypothetical protein
MELLRKHKNTTLRKSLFIKILRVQMLFLDFDEGIKIQIMSYLSN